MKLYLLAALPLLSAQPRISNFQQQTRAAGTLPATMSALVAAQKSPAWIAYAAPQLPGERQMCCWSSNVQGCSLEPQSGTVVPPAPPGMVHLEGAPEFYIFLRVENQRIEKIRTFSLECSLDGGGLPLYWLTGVNPAQSVAWLESLISSALLPGDRKLADNAISAIALHRTPAADAALDRLSAPAQAESIRRQAAFWLGNARGRHGYESLARLVRTDPSEKVREHVIFALTQSKEADAIPLIARVAREDKSASVRSKAIFWLAKRATSPSIQATIRAAVEQDPDVKVKKQAVFALTQIPDAAGIPLLIEVARSSRLEEVKKQAIFWLGKSKDARAVRFFEEVLAAR